MLRQNQRNQPTMQRPTHYGFTFLLSCTLFALCCLSSLPSNAQTSRTETQNRSANNVRHPLAEPLAVDDPRAVLSPELRNAAPIPSAAEFAPNVQAESVQEPKMVEFNLRTGRETQSKGHIAAEAMQSELHQASVSGYQGPTAQADQGDRTAEKKARSGAQAESCGDNSQVNHSTRSYPMSAQVKLFMRFPNGGTYEGTGTMIGSKYVLTSMNNVYQAGFGGLATWIEVVPGLDGYYKPFGSAYASWIRYYYDGYSKVGLLTLDRHIGNSTGWLGYGSFSDSYLASRLGHQFGYRLDKDYGRGLYYSYGAIQNLNRDWLSVAVTFNSGEMGAGMYLLDSYGSRYVFAVNQNTWYCGSWGSRLTDWVTGQLRYVITNGW